MVTFSICIEGFAGLTWPRWRDWIAALDASPFTALYISDHLVAAIPPDLPSMEAIVALTYLADHSTRLRFGTLVSPLSIRDPVMLVRQAILLDELSDGRMILGVGAGWMNREHTMFGYDLGDVPTRMERFSEGVAVINHLLHAAAPVCFTGRFFRLQAAQLVPGGAGAGRLPLLIAGNGPQRTLPLVARYADIWNAQGTDVETLRQRMARLDTLLLQEGREPGAVKRTVAAPVLVADDREELGRRLEAFPFAHAFAAQGEDAFVAFLRARLGAIVGTRDEVVATIKEYAAAGIEELVVQWFARDDFAGMARIAEEIVPRCTG
jgi:alkanesulfonate monooxygenase SsuD/methylene tetrahydromethanopterin reductase-like flavin-dependent oxidoreductase (luciferase family)